MRRITVRMSSSWLVAALLVTLYSSHAAADRAQAKEWFDKGRRLQAAGDKSGALEHYERAIAEDADYEIAYERAARLWISEQAFERAIANLERFTLRHPGHAFAWYALAYSYRRTSRYEYAALAYEGYIDLRPEEAAPYFGLGMVRLRLHDHMGARVAFERYVALERDPARRGFVTQAKRELESLAAKAKQTNRDRRAPTSSAIRRVAAATFSQQMVHLQRMMGNRRFASAQTLAEQLQPTTSQETLSLAMVRARIFIARGLTDKAREVLWSVLAAAPTSIEVYLLLHSLE